MTEVLRDAKIVVGLDIGMEYSACAYAFKRKPDETCVVNDWPIITTRNTSRTTSAIYYGQGDATTAEVLEWGNRASCLYNRKTLHGYRTNDDNYFGDFKRLLASKGATKLPKGFTATQVIADYLRLIGACVMNRVQRRSKELGVDFTMDDVQWCVTVPSDSGDHARKLMEVCMERAGLIRSATSPRGSPHPLSVVFDREAASCRCLPELDIKVGDKLLEANIRNEASDIFMQEVVWVGQFSYRMKEVATSFGVFGGGMYLDKQFEELMFAKIPWLNKFSQVEALPVSDPSFENTVEHIKYVFGGARYIGESVDVFLPATLRARWKAFDKEQLGNPPRPSYSKVVLTYEEIETFFNPFVHQIVGFIKDQLLTTPTVKAIAVVGEWKGCPYLRSKIKQSFLQKEVMSLVDAETVVCKGAVMLALDQGINALTGGAQLLEYHGPASSSSTGGGIAVTSSSQEFSELLPANGSTSSGPVLSSSTSSGASEPSPTVDKPSDNSIAEDVVKKYTWDQVLHLTKDLTSKQLGRGSFGTVYLGKLENGKEVALKILDPSSQQGMPEFLNEVNLLKRVNHVNLVRLFGYCQDEQQVLVYEFAEEGSIWDHLHGERTRLNDWRLRLSIALQAACGMLSCATTVYLGSVKTTSTLGLEYLHTLCSPSIIHRDIKSENILLTKTMVAKVADFGVSRLGAEEDNINEKTHFTTKVLGTRGYLDPEYHLTSQLRHSSDVYSFGVVLLEIISGRKPVPNSDLKCCIGNWVGRTYGSGGGTGVKAVADSAFDGRYNPKAMKLMIKLAMWCIHPSGESRPKMSDVVRELRKAQTLELDEGKSWFAFL